MAILRDIYFRSSTQTLIYLYLQNNQIKDTGAQQLAEALNTNKVRSMKVILVILDSFFTDDPVSISSK